MTLKEKQIAKAVEICDLYASNKYTIESCCENQGVLYRTFHNWVSESSKHYTPEIAELYKKACITKSETRKKNLIELRETIGEKALQGLARKIEGWTWEEVTVAGQNKTKGKTVKKVTKMHVPDTAAIIFSLTNAFPDEFKNRKNTDITSGGRPIVDKIEIEIVHPTISEKDGNT